MKNVRTYVIAYRILLKRYESYKLKLTISRQLLVVWPRFPTPTHGAEFTGAAGNLYLCSTAWMRARVVRTRAPKRATRDILGPCPPRYALGEAGQLVSAASSEIPSCFLFPPPFSKEFISRRRNTIMLGGN